MKLRTLLVGATVTAAAIGGSVVATMPSAQAAVKYSHSVCTYSGSKVYCSVPSTLRFQGKVISTSDGTVEWQVRGSTKYYLGCARDKQIYAQLRAASAKNYASSRYAGIGYTQRQQASNVYHLLSSHHCV